MMTSYRNFFLYLIFCCSFLFPWNTCGQSAMPSVYDTFFAPVKWRCIGPFRGGRSGAVSGVKGDPFTYYMGITGGGVWKTDDAGLTWSNISDKYFSSGSVGAIAVAPNDANVVYVGMGEHAVRGVMTHHGDGMYKSTDAGKTWKHIGLKSSQHIARIVIHPQDPDVLWVAVQGALYGPSEERGVFKSTDGGNTWKKVLYIDRNSGCSELSIDAGNPRILYATTWEYGRKPWQVISGGPGSCVYKSKDGGNTWEKIVNGLPKELGKMAISCAPSNGEKVYLLAESDSEKEAGGLFVSDNGGRSWSKVSSDHRLIQRAWYYTEVFTDPVNENLVYVLNALALRSIDGGKTWEIIDGPHGDYHDLWINPENPKNMIIADDGGGSVTFNGGKSWSPQDNVPTAQLYRLNADNLLPYNVYAGQQDNTSVKLASTMWGKYGIDKTGLSASAGGESAFLAFNPDHPRYVMGGSYLGTIEYFDSQAKTGRNIMPAPIQYLAMEPKNMKYRYNWNAPIIYSKHEKNTFYHAAHKLLKTQDNGHSWQEISPDLTRNDVTKQGKGGVPYTNEIVGAENYGTISYVIESKTEAGTIWVGSDDGLVHITRDGGKTWKNVTPTGLKECLINAIEVSGHDQGTAYIATTRYKFNDHTPGLYKTTDYGKTWKPVNKGIHLHDFTRVVREDDVDKNLLFAGTENGIYISFNGGEQWHSFRLNMPISPITDLMIHQNNLIASTSGRSIWILDDLHVLQNFNESKRQQNFLFETKPVMLVSGGSEMNGDISSFSGMNGSKGVNACTAVPVYYTLKDTISEEIKLEIYDDKNKLIRSYSSKPDSAFLTYDGGPSAESVFPSKTGLNRFVWDLKHESVPGVKNVYIEANYTGHRVIPGTYSIQLKAGEFVAKTDVMVLPNPEYTLSESEYTHFDSVMNHFELQITEMHEMIENIFQKANQLKEILTIIPAGSEFDSLRNQVKALIEKMETWDEKMIQRKTKAYDDVENFENKFTADYLFLMNHADGDMMKINLPTLQRKEELDTIWSGYKAEAINILEKETVALNKLLWEKGVGAIWR